MNGYQMALNKINANMKAPADGGGELKRSYAVHQEGDRSQLSEQLTKLGHQYGDLYEENQRLKEENQRLKQQLDNPKRRKVNIQETSQTNEEAKRERKKQLDCRRKKRLDGGPKRKKSSIPPFITPVMYATILRKMSVEEQDVLLELLDRTTVKNYWVLSVEELVEVWKHATRLEKLFMLEIEARVPEFDHYYEVRNDWKTRINEMDDYLKYDSEDLCESDKEVLKIQKISIRQRLIPYIEEVIKSAKETNFMKKELEVRLKNAEEDWSESTVGKFLSEVKGR